MKKSQCPHFNGLCPALLLALPRTCLLPFKIPGLFDFEPTQVRMPPDDPFVFRPLYFFFIALSLLSGPLGAAKRCPLLVACSQPTAASAATALAAFSF